MNTSQVYLSAINADDCCTLSGRGDQLQRFVRDKLLAEYRVKETNVRSLYHSRTQLTKLRQQLVEDLRRRLPSFSAPLVVVAPVFSTIDGKAIRFPAPSSLEVVCNILFDMILLEPVDWQAVQIGIISTIEQSTAGKQASCEILNFGPGYGMSRSKHTLPDNVQIKDVSSANSHQPLETTSAAFADDDIAIVGIGIDLPGAPNVATLWDNLSGGVNSCSEVRTYLHYQYAHIQILLSASTLTVSQWVYVGYL